MELTEKVFGLAVAENHSFVINHNPQYNLNSVYFPFPHFLIFAANLKTKDYVYRNSRKNRKSC